MMKRRARPVKAYSHLENLPLCKHRGGTSFRKSRPNRWPPINADKRGLKTDDLSAFIRVHRRPEIVFHQPLQPVKGGCRQDCLPHKPCPFTKFFERAFGIPMPFRGLPSVNGKLAVDTIRFASSCSGEVRMFVPLTPIRCLH